MNKLCTVIMPAYKSMAYIDEAIESLAAQTPREGWDYNLRLGIDGCPFTREKVVTDETLGQFWYSEENVGAYVMRNSLIFIGLSDVYMTFDADDVMLPEYISTMLRVVEEEEADIVGAAHYYTEADGRLLGARPYQGGVCTFTLRALNMLGGFRSDRYASDTDFVFRARDAGLSVQSIRVPLFNRRIHDKSLTRGPGAPLHSPPRDAIIQAHNAMREEGHIHVVDPETVEHLTLFTREEYSPRYWPNE